MQFKPLESVDQFKKVSEAEGAHIIFKHNTTCPISKSVIKKLEQERDLLPTETPVYILDLLANRDVSDSVATTFGVEHASPQLLLIKDGKCIYNESLYNISAAETAHALDQSNS
jgi:bacillithiol system protein YtxJ